MILPIAFAETVRKVDGRIAIRSVLAAALLLCGPVASSARAAVAVDAVTPHDSGRYTRSFSFDHTVGTGPARLLIVAVIDGNRDSSVTSLTHGGVALTRIDRTVGTGVAAELWRLIAPASGTQTVVVTMSNNQDRPIATAVSYTGVDQTAPVGMAGGASGSGTAVSISVPSAPGDYVMDAGSAWVTRAPPNATAGAGQTQRWSLNNGVDTRAMGSEKIAAATTNTTTMTWTVTGMTSWVSIGVAVKAATTAPPRPDGAPLPDAPVADGAPPPDAGPPADLSPPGDERPAPGDGPPSRVDAAIPAATQLDLKVGTACSLAASAGNRAPWPAPAALAVLALLAGRTLARRRRCAGRAAGSAGPTIDDSGNRC